MIWRPVPGDALLGFIGVALLAAFAVPFVGVLACRFPCDAVPRQSADLEKIRRKASKFWILRRAEALCGPAALGLVIRMFDARVHWKPRLPSMQRWKRRFLMLFDDWMCLWYPILDIAASASLAVLSSVVSGDATSCIVVVGLTSAVYLILFAGSLLRPCMNWLNNGYLVLVNALSIASSISLLYNQLSPNNDAVQFSVLCLFGVTALTSLKTFPDLIVKVVALLLASIRARPPSTIRSNPILLLPSLPPSLMAEPEAPAGDSSVNALPTESGVVVAIDQAKPADEEDAATTAPADGGALHDALEVNELDDDAQRELEDQLAATFFATSAAAATSDPPAGNEFLPKLLLLDDTAPTQLKRNDLLEAYGTARADDQVPTIDNQMEFDLDDLLDQR